jgi:hypothetical protein
VRVGGPSVSRPIVLFSVFEGRLPDWPCADQGAREMTAKFEGQKPMAVGGGSGMGRDSAADVVAGGCAVIVGREQARVDETAATLLKDGPV